MTDEAPSRFGFEELRVPGGSLDFGGGECEPSAPPESSARTKSQSSVHASEDVGRGELTGGHD